MIAYLVSWLIMIVLRLCWVLVVSFERLFGQFTVCCCFELVGALMVYCFELPFVKRYNLV